MDTELKERLQGLAAEMPADPRMPVQVRRRVRLRRVRNATVTVAVAISLFVGGSIGIPAALRASGRPHPPVPGDNGGEWRGLWPQATRQEAEQAQACADSGDENCAWQLDPRATILRWLEAQGGSVKADFAVPVGITQSDTPGPYSIEVSGAYQPGFTFEVTIERLVREDHTGIWSVTDPTMSEASPMLMPWAQVRAFVTKFMEFRVKDIADADTFMSAEAKDAYDRHDGGLWLYSPSHEEHFVSFVVGDQVLQDVSTPDDFVIEVGIRSMSPGQDQPAEFRETLLVGPGVTADGKDLPYVVLSAARGGVLPTLSASP
jgi:hypothetical protein